MKRSRPSFGSLTSVEKPSQVMQDSVHQWHNHLGTTIFIQQKSGETGLLVETLPSFRFEAVEAVASEVSFVIQVLQGPTNQHQSKNYCSKAVPLHFLEMCFQESGFFFQDTNRKSEDEPPRYFDNYFPDFCNSIHDNFHQVMDPLAPTLLETCTMALVGVVFLCFVTPKKGWVLSEERPCFVSMAVDFDCEHLFLCFSFCGFADVFYFSAHRPSVTSFMTDFPFAGPEPWHLGEPTSAFWRRSNIPQIKEIMDFRIRSNYSRAFLRIPEFC